MGERETFVLTPNRESGEVMVTSTTGTVQFMGLGEAIAFIWDALNAGRNVEVNDD